MDTLQVFILALIQGLTEFLPISSSAHLILPSAILGWQDQGLAFDVAVHVGSLLAVVWYFRQDILDILSHWFKQVGGGPVTPNSRLGWYIIIATIPAGIFGLLLDDFIEANLRTIAVIAATTILFGLLLGAADKQGAKVKPMTDFTWKTALILGFAQAMALIPGTSRSGITITAALFLGFQREAAARFSFLMAIPVITLGGGYKALQLMQLPEVPWGMIGLGTLISAITAYLCIHFFLAWINRIGMMPFVWYRLILGAILIWLVIFQ